MKFEINRKLWPMKAHYFLFNAGTGSILFYLPTLIKQMGFSAVVIGILFATFLIMTIVSRPVFGIIADKFKIQKTLFLLFMFMTAIALFTPYFLPAVSREAAVGLMCDKTANFYYCDDQADSCVFERITGSESSEEMKCETTCRVSDEEFHVLCKTWTMDCSEVKNEISFQAFVPRNAMNAKDQCLNLEIYYLLFENQNTTMSTSCVEQVDLQDCTVNCNDSEISDLMANEISIKEASELSQFWILFVILIAASAGMALVVSFADTICFQLLGDNPELYGYQRLWGSLGWGTFSLLAGYLVDVFSQGQFEKDYSIAFYMALSLLLLDVAVSTQLKHTPSEESEDFLREFCGLLSSFKTIVFLLWCVAAGLATGLIYGFLFWHLEELAREEGCSSMDWMKTLQGIAMAIQNFGGELPFFWWSGYILKKIGHINAMTLVLAGYGVRFMLYSFLVNPWWVLPIELFQGLTFGLFWTTMASYASIVAPSGTETTVQGVVGGIYEGVGASMGSLIGGILVNQIGSGLTFRYYAIAAFGLAAVHWVVNFFIRRSEARNSSKI